MVKMNRRSFIRSGSALTIGLGAYNPAFASLHRSKTAEQGPLEIGSRRELFLDPYLVDSLTGGASRRLHHPVPREVVLSFDRP